MLSTLIILAAALAPAPARAEVLQDPKAFLKEQLGSHPKKAKESFTLTADQKKRLKEVAERATDESLTFYYARDAKDALQAACTVVPQEGKEGPMQIGVCLDGTGVVTAVRVLEFEEERGKPVKELKFLKQFQGKKATAAFRVGKDVDAVSGATRSSESVSEAVRKASFGYRELVEKKGKK
jgi:Na+-translocating ferredoxin:NAD+ oxidoreductase RnfG subunit